MEGCRLIVIDKHQSTRLLIRAALIGTPHEIVDEADTTEKAAVSIAMARKLGANVILLGGDRQQEPTEDSFTGQVLDIINDTKTVDPDFRPAILVFTAAPSQI